MSKHENVNEHYVLRNGLNSLRALMNKKNDLKNLTPDQDADEQAVADKNKYYSMTDPDDIDYDTEWVFINRLEAKYSVLPDIKS
ncbi:hypothetical protein [Pantoea sp.]|uniref:hypothetical protein n=1 Tax=Pantoea sp. TaxID=69393 RepID=UPI0031DDD05A